MPIEIRETLPTDPSVVTEAPAPIPVRVRVQWMIGTDWTIIDEAWAMAWTRTEFLVYWRMPGALRPTTVWLHKGQVRRR